MDPLFNVEFYRSSDLEGNQIIDIDEMSVNIKTEQLWVFIYY